MKSLKMMFSLTNCCLTRRHFTSPRAILFRGKSSVQYGDEVMQKWKSAIDEAENFVGCSKMKMEEQIFSGFDESQVDKFISSKTKKIFQKHYLDPQLRRLLVLLLARAAGHTKNSSDKSEAESMDGMSHRQRKLAEITEMIHLAHQMHLELDDGPSIWSSEMENEIIRSQNNNLVLVGDLIFASIWKGLVELGCDNTIEAMSSAIANSVEGHFFDALEEEGKYFNSILVQRQFLKVASLQANSCRASLDLAGHGIVAQAKAFNFGKNVAMAIEMYREVAPFCPEYLANESKRPHFDLTCTPVVIYFKETACNLHSFRHPNGPVDKEKLFKSVKASGAVEKAKVLIKLHCDHASEALGYFKASKSIEILTNMVNTLRSLAER